MSKAFTLIELLVVVAIIAILAAIAVPNFLEAQTRAKYSRVLADMRTMAVAAEAYAVDRNRVPRMTWGDPPFSDLYTGYGTVNEPIFGTFGPWMTTPVAYMTSFDNPLDAFCGNDQSQRMDARLYTYHDLYIHRRMSGTPGSQQNATFPDRFEREFGAYAIMSLGPDKTEGTSAGGPNAFWEQYDPTNGTRSEGNVWRSQKYRENRYYNLVN